MSYLIFVCSLKDQFNVAGFDSTIGYVARVGKPASKQSTLVKLLLDAGAVLYVKTNVPATLMMGETVNNLFGRTLNPYNRKLSPSGSSGGESALIAMKGSYLGVGTVCDSLYQSVKGHLLIILT